MSDDKKVVAKDLTFDQLLRTVAIGQFARLYGALKQTPKEDKPKDEESTK